MILITGATGTIGRALTSELLSLGHAVRAMTRDPEKARTLLSKEVEVVRGDFTDSASLAAALEGVGSLFLLSAPGPTNAEHDLAMMAAVKRAKVAKVVKMSAYGTGDAQPLTAASWHAPGEQAVMQSGRAWTLLRPAAFASNALSWAASIRAQRPIEIATGEGRHATVDPRDVAAVAARALTSSVHDGQAYTLTGPEALTAREQVEIIGRVLGRALAVAETTPERAAEQMRQAGVPMAFTEAVREGLTFVREGRAAAVSDAVEQVLGRPPRSFEHWVRENAALFG